MRAYTCALTARDVLVRLLRVDDGNAPGAVTMFRLRDNSTKVAAQHQYDKRTAPSTGDGGVGDGDGLAWRKILRGFTCDRRDATPWESRVRFTDDGEFSAGSCCPFPPKSSLTRHLWLPILTLLPNSTV